MQGDGGWGAGGGDGSSSADGAAAPPAYEHRVRLLQARLEAALPKLAEALESRGGALGGPAPTAAPTAEAVDFAPLLQPATQWRSEGQFAGGEKLPDFALPSLPLPPLPPPPPYYQQQQQQQLHHHHYQHHTTAREWPPQPPTAPQRSPAWEAHEARLRGAVEAARAAAGPRAPATLTALHEHAALLASAGLAREAEAEAREALAGRWAVLGVGHDCTQDSFALVMGIFKAMGVRRNHMKQRELSRRFKEELLEWNGGGETRGVVRAPGVRGGGGGGGGSGGGSDWVIGSSWGGGGVGSGSGGGGGGGSGFSSSWGGGGGGGGGGGVGGGGAGSGAPRTRAGAGRGQQHQAQHQAHSAGGSVGGWQGGGGARPHAPRGGH